VIPSNSLAVGIPGKVKRQVTEEEIINIKHNAERYEELWRDEHM
jgi:carbonic anhydrase/acetyltransferase-like protein (isoleucine patch superfamily)